MEKEERERKIARRHYKPRFEEVDNVGLVSHQKVILAPGVALRLH